VGAPERGDRAQGAGPGVGGSAAPAADRRRPLLIEVGFISEQIAALSGRPEQAAAARLVLVAVVQAEARSTLEGAIEAADPATRQQLIALLGDVDDATARVGLAA